MNQKHFFKYFLTIILFSIHLNVWAQITTEEKLLGCWKVSKFEFIKPVEDSANLITGMKNFISCFEKDGKFVTKINANNDKKIIGTGTFNIGSDGKTIYQKRNTEENGVDSAGEIVILNDKELAIKVDNVVIHLVKIIK